LHVGSPQPIGGDFIGIDVNIAARLCEAAEPDEILLTDRTVAALDEVPEVEERPPRRLIGVPAHIGLYGMSADAA